MTRQVKTHIRLGIRSVSPSEQSPRCPHGETLLTYLPTHRKISRSFSAKSHGVSPRNLAEFLRELSRSFSAKFRGESLGEICDFCFSPRKTLFRARGVPWRNAKKELFSWADLYFCLFLYMYIAPGQGQTPPWEQNFYFNINLLSLVICYKFLPLNDCLTVFPHVKA